MIELLPTTTLGWLVTVCYYAHIGVYTTAFYGVLYNYLGATNE